MSRHLLREATEDELTAALRGLDAAPATTRERAGSPRAGQDLERILQQEPLSPPVTMPRAGSSRWPRLAWLVPVAGAVAVAGLVGSVLGDEPGSGAAWSAVPTVPSSQERQAAREQCVDLHQGAGRPGQADTEAASPAGFGSATEVLSERRGPWVFTMLAGPDGLVVDCLLHQDPQSLIAERPEGTSVSTGGGGSRRVDTDPLDPEEIQPFTLSRDHMDIGGYATVTGRAGSEVTDITITTPDGRHVQATVENGYWAAWWPLESSTPTEQYPTITVTHADGTQTDAVPFDQLFRP